mmetsp:Transcript_22020/g.68321  ORF Transcript_22020/g.68321 Transcript_22020/m.68321 type:complete len:256 (+) Transcript_22020:968-1735(+)
MPAMSATTPTPMAIKAMLRSRALDASADWVGVLGAPPLLPVSSGPPGVGTAMVGAGVGALDTKPMPLVSPTARIVVAACAVAPSASVAVHVNAPDCVGAGPDTASVARAVPKPVFAHVTPAVVQILQSSEATLSESSATKLAIDTEPEVDAEESYSNTSVLAVNTGGRFSLNPTVSVLPDVIVCLALLNASVNSEPPTAASKQHARSPLHAAGHPASTSAVMKVGRYVAFVTTPIVAGNSDADASVTSCVSTKSS